MWAPPSPQNYTRVILGHSLPSWQEGNSSYGTPPHASPENRIRARLKVQGVLERNSMVYLIDRFGQSDRPNQAFQAWSAGVEASLPSRPAMCVSLKPLRCNDSYVVLRSTGMRPIEVIASRICHGSMRIPHSAPAMRLIVSSINVPPKSFAPPFRIA